MKTKPGILEERIEQEVEANMDGHTANRTDMPRGNPVALIVQRAPNLKSERTPPYGGYSDDALYQPSSL
jgi:hypothetical protein